MKSHWLIREGRDKLLLVFAGWGLGAASFEGMRSEVYDVICFDDYRDLETKPELFQGYSSYALLAYSFGVASAGHWMSRHSLTIENKTAVAGTLFPADDQRGIPPLRIATMSEALDEVGFQKFCKRAGHPKPPFGLDLSLLRQQLQAIVARGAVPDAVFDRVWVTQKDRIIPAAAQATAWSGYKGAMHVISEGHHPFKPEQLFEDWLS